MARIEAKQHVSATEGLPPNQSLRGLQTGSAQDKSVYVSNNDSPHDKFCSHEGIDRGRGHQHNLHGKKAGDQVEITNGDSTLVGTVLKSTGHTLEVLVGNQVYTVEKETGKADGHRQASAQEMQQAAQMQEYQEEQERVQEQDSAKADAVINDNRKQYDVKLYDKKVELRADALKKMDSKAKAVQSLSEQFQYQAPKTENRTLTVGEILLNKFRELELKNKVE